MGQDIKQITVLGINDRLHLGQLGCTETILLEALEQPAPGAGELQSARSSASSFTNSGNLP
jgi:hypothetical protein